MKAYVIRISEEGYFGKKPYTPMPLEEATVFPSMKAARKQENRLRSVLKYPNATIESYL